MMVEVVWHSKYPENVMEKVIADINENFEDGVFPENLIFHSVMLTDDDDGPSVFLWGVSGDSRFHAEYFETTEWESVKL